MEKRANVDISRYARGIVVAGGAIIVLAVLLFVNAMSIADLGRSTAWLASAFALVTGLACGLLVLIFRARRAGGAACVRRTPAARAEAPQGSAGGMAEASAELRTTVGVIQEELEEILDDEVPADREHMQLLYEETDRLKKIIDSMERLSRVAAVTRPESRESLLIEPLLQGVIETTRAAVTDRQVTYTLECEAGLAMQGNAECISQIIGNIVDNAARSIRGSGSVAVTAVRQGDKVAFSVQDTGTGIRRAHLTHIYERFFRGTGSGVGMGLAIARELVDACGGSIEVQTAVNKGTTFTVLLPAG